MIQEFRLSLVNFWLQMPQLQLWKGSSEGEEDVLGPYDHPTMSNFYLYQLRKSAQEPGSAF